VLPTLCFMYWATRADADAARWFGSGSAVPMRAITLASGPS